MSAAALKKENVATVRAQIDDADDTLQAFLNVSRKPTFQPGSMMTTMVPMRAFMAGTRDNSDRVYAGSIEYLLNPLADLVGDSTEMCVPENDDRIVTWTGFRLERKLPRYVVRQPGTSVYSLHSRAFRDGHENYLVTWVSIDKHGRMVPLGGGGANAHNLLSQRVAYNRLVICASVVEDARRPDAMTATLSTHAAIVMPVKVDVYKEVFSIREGPLTPTGKKRAIYHAVRRHRRQLREDIVVPVKRHWRGVHEFAIEELHVSLEAPK